MKDPKLLPVAKVVLRLADGSTVEREWTMDALGEAPEAIRPGGGGGLPGWLRNARKQWDHPQDPIVFSGDVLDGFEAAARAWVGKQ